MSESTQAYLMRLCEQFWIHAKNHSLVDDRFLDRVRPEPTRPPVFHKHEAWRNVILPSEADPSVRRRVMGTLPESGRHRWFGSMKSSQALAQSVFGNLTALKKCQVLGELIDDDGLPAFFHEIGSSSVSLEHDVKVFKEPRPTSVDVWVEGAQTVAVECKLTEADFGTCSRPRRDPEEDQDYCDGSYRVQMNRRSRCALTELGIEYWKYIPQLFNWSPDEDMILCAFGTNYQLVRNVLAACVDKDGSISAKGRHALVIYDARNPAFQTGGVADRQWRETRSSLRYPELLRRCSWQRLVALIGSDPQLNWLVGAIEDKYGIVAPQEYSSIAEPSLATR